MNDLLEQAKGALQRLAATEKLWIYILLGGLALAIVGYLWLLRRAVAASKWWRVGWLPPLAALYGLFRPRSAKGPLFVFLLGCCLVATPYLFTQVIEPAFPSWFRHPWETDVDGERHLTLTGLPGFDYAQVAKRTDVVVLQMANADVTDATLEHLRGLGELRELDLKDTAITDDGLKVLASLPKLKTLRLRGTKITDAGFAHVAAIETLREIDAQETEIKSATLRAWKKGHEDRKFLK